MGVVTWAGPDRLEIERRRKPDAAPGWVVLRTDRVGICGSDLSILHGHHARAQPGTVIGHEFIGTVVEVGSGVDLAVGTRGAVFPLISCADHADGVVCDACAAGHPHVCARLGLYGVDEPGAFAEYVAVRAHSVVPLGDDVEDALAALAEPLAVSVHAVERSGLEAGQAVAVFGGGPIGLLTAMVARERGAGSVVVVEPNEWRAGVARQLGFEVLAPDDAVTGIRERTGGAGAHVVFDGAGHPSVTPQLTDAVRIRGTIVIVGVYAAPPATDLRAVNFRELSIIGTRVYRRQDFVDAVALLDDDRLGLRGLPVLQFPLAEAEEAFVQAQKGIGSMKVLVAPNGGILDV